MCTILRYVSHKVFDFMNDDRNCCLLEPAVIVLVMFFQKCFLLYMGVRHDV